MPKSSRVSTYSRMILILLAGMVVCREANAQSGVRYYPDRLYPGKNVITLTSNVGIERIRTRTTVNASADDPVIERCENEVRVTVYVGSAETNEEVQFTVYECDGNFRTRAIGVEKWDIRHEYTGPVEIGRDTCLPCEIVSGDGKLFDSISTSNPNLTINLPAASSDGMWRVRGGVPFRYEVCYAPDAVEERTDSIFIVFKREQPSGGLDHYSISKPVTVRAVEPPPPPKSVEPLTPALPPLADPTTYRTIVMPTAEVLDKGQFFIGNYVLVGWLAGYGVTDDLMVLGGGIVVPDFISRLLVGTLGGKYQVVRSGDFLASLGFQYAYSSSEESDITTYAPYGTVSYGDGANRVTVTAGYSWKHHVSPVEIFDREAAMLLIGGDVTIARGWKLAGETYLIETSGIAPVLLTARYFSSSFAFDFGLGIDLAGSNEVRSTSALAGEIDRLAVAPVISAMWVW